MTGPTRSHVDAVELLMLLLLVLVEMTEVLVLLVNLVEVTLRLLLWIIHPFLSGFSSS